MSQTDMLLELSVLSYHRLSPRQVALKRFDSNGGTLGRAEHADWHLPDPERVVSSIHAQISFIDNAFWITDCSTNGLFVNRSVTALGQGNRHRLADEDLLCLGDYEIKAAIVNASQAATASPAQRNDVKNHAQLTSAAELPYAQLTNNNENIGVVPQPLGLAVNQLQQAASPGSVSGRPGISGDSSAHNPAMAANAASAALYNNADVLANDNMLSESFTPPQSMIPDDWQPQWQQQSLPDEPLELAIASTADSSAARTVIIDQTNAQQCLQAFLSALNVPAPAEQQLQNPAWWSQLGEALQASLQGVIDVMRSRSEMKSNLRVNQTTFQQRENNPLKFSATISEAFHNLFNNNASSFMAPRQAITAAFADISQHEAAIIAGAAGAMQGMLAQLAPQLLEQRDFGASFIDKVNPTQRYSRYWSLYQALHQELQAEVTRTAKGGVNDDFIRAYEDYLTNRK
ncbi:hypothetical protein WG68_05285 [Arsukibacterium ikkense]|uniref:FHA domain-containing protein n=1 Tax=Arsukibacterium ikkense TaxID=336831 RepID=A0A0M2V791_9GAMM|nr:type VI secretion system-associated FHA domain protein TagH [Arsukibacterium ikkense]KKO46697.1 hypothetical protein WG68_05285 [Arsukibacterium ikkense]